MAEFKKSDAIDYAHTVRILVEALIDEGFGTIEAETHVFRLMEATASKNTVNTLFS